MRAIFDNTILIYSKTNTRLKNYSNIVLFEHFESAASKIKDNNEVEPTTEERDAIKNTFQKKGYVRIDYYFSHFPLVERTFKRRNQSNQQQPSYIDFRFIQLTSNMCKRSQSHDKHYRTAVVVPYEEI